MRNYTGSKRVRNAADAHDYESGNLKRHARRVERRVLKEDTARQVEQLFFDEIEEAEALEAMLDEIFGDGD